MAKWIGPRHDFINSRRQITDGPWITGRHAASMRPSWLPPENRSLFGGTHPPERYAELVQHSRRCFWKQQRQVRWPRKWEPIAGPRRYPYPACVSTIGRMRIAVRRLAQSVMPLALGSREDEQQ